MDEKQAELFQIVVFNLSDEVYGVNIGDVYEILRQGEVTKVPRTASFIEGVMNLRGKIVPVIDLRQRFGLPAGENGKQRRIIVVKIGEHTVGMIVDAVSEVLQIHPSQVEEVSTVVSSQVDTEFISGIAKVEERLIILLDLERVLTGEEKAKLGKVEEKAQASLAPTAGSAGEK